jgi:hypothetical protein
MNTQKEVFNKLFKEEKTELSTQKVELGIMKDLEKSYDKHKNQRASIDNSLTSWYNELFKVRDKFSKIENEYKQFNASVDDLKKYTKEAESMAKELGVSESSIPNYKEAKALINTSGDVKDEFKYAKKLETKIG